MQLALFDGSGFVFSWAPARSSIFNVSGADGPRVKCGSLWEERQDVIRRENFQASDHD